MVDTCALEINKLLFLYTSPRLAQQLFVGHAILQNLPSVCNK